MTFHVCERVGIPHLIFRDSHFMRQFTLDLKFQGKKQVFKIILAGIES